MATILARHADSSAILGPVRLEPEVESARVRLIETGEMSPLSSLDVPSRFVHDVEALGRDELRRLRLIHGHMVFGIHEVLPQPSTYVTLLRNPVERVLSLYHHRAKYQGLRMALDEYVRQGRDWEMVNNQIYHLAGGTRNATMAELLEIAKRNLCQHFAVVGLTERFDDTLTLLRRLFGLKRLEYVPEVVGEGRIRAEDVADDVIEAIKEANRYDSELYRFAENLFDEKLAAQSPSIEGELTRFRERNRAYWLRTGKRNRRRRMWAARLTKSGRPGRAALKGLQALSRSGVGRSLRRV